MVALGSKGMGHHECGSGLGVKGKVVSKYIRRQ